MLVEFKEFFMSKIKIALILSFLVFASLVNTKKEVFAANPNCYSTFYQTKNFDCVDSLIEMLSAKYSKSKSFNHSNIQSIVGFITGVFKNNSDYKELALNRDTPLYTKSVFMAALYRAGLIEEAKTYANDNSLEKLFKAYKKNSVELLEDLKPRYLPYDNDFLIGVFMATGNKKYVIRTIGNYKTVSKEKARDAFRIALVKSKFGTNLSSKVRKSEMLKNICIKYECKKSQKDFYRIMTLSTAYWSLRSLSKKHEIIKDTLMDFFEDNKKLKNILDIERNNFSNYLTMLPLYAANIDDEKIEDFMISFENLEDVSVQDIVK